MQLAVCLFFALGILTGAEDKKVDPTGAWKWSVTTPTGQVRENILKLKLEGDKLTGTISGQAGEMAIEGAKLKGEEITFQVGRDLSGNKFTTKYTGKISGDTIKGKMEMQRDGQVQSREWEAKREKAKAKDSAAQ